MRQFTSVRDVVVLVRRRVGRRDRLGRPRRVLQARLDVRLTLRRDPLGVVDGVPEPDLGVLQGRRRRLSPARLAQEGDAAAYELAAEVSCPPKVGPLKWESSGRVSPGGLHEEEARRRRSGAIAEGRRPRSGQGADRRRRLSEDRRGRNDVLSLASDARPRPNRRRSAMPSA